MGIRFTCHACTKRLNVKAFLAGKRGICPHCGTKVEIPWQSQTAGEELEDDPSPSVVPQSVASAGYTNGSAAPTATAPMQASIPMAAPVAQTAAPVAVAATAPTVAQSAPAQALSAVPLAPASPPPPAAAPDPIDEAPGAVWYVRPPSGGQYGPASGEIMRKWVAEGRVSSDSLVWREGWADWKSASELFASLGGGPAAAAPSAPAPVTAAPTMAAVSPAGNEANAPGRGYPRRRKNNSLAVILVILLTLASLGLFGVLIAVINFIQ